jgi:RNA polymerase sigma-70 factor (ECF subfamily)
VYNFICYRINTRTDAEELTSAIFEKVISKFYMYHPERAPLEAWIISIAKNVVTDYFRGAKKRAFLPLDEISATLSDKRTPEDTALLNEEKRILLKALSVLSDKERTIIAMKFAAELKHAEIAKIMAVSEANVGSIVHRSIKKMRANMEGGLS